MSLYNIFFFGSLFFLIGVFLASVQAGIFIVFGTTIFALILFLSWLATEKRFVRTLSFLSLFIILGTFYYNIYAVYGGAKQSLVFDRKVDVVGIVSNNPSIRGNTLEAKLNIKDPFYGTVLLKLSRVSRIQYGDMIRVRGVIQRPEPEGFARYLEKEGMYGVMKFSDVEFISAGNGLRVKEFLFSVRNSAISSFREILPQKESAFLSGLTFGGRSDFTKEFEEEMKLSGTTHLVALSGYNISILVLAIIGMLTYVFSRRVSHLLAFVAVIGFVVMTGAEASVVRAAIMAMLLALAEGFGRSRDMRNLFAFTALVMVFSNPKILVFDVGFQLSFLALLGIVYVKPALSKIFHFSKNPGFLSWRENFLTTLSAQITVIPLLVSQFGYFSISSLAANVLILELVPITMGFGFAIAFASFFSNSIALVLGWIVWILLRIEVLIIKLFAKLSVSFGLSAGIALAICIYVGLAFFIWYGRRKNTNYT